MVAGAAEDQQHEQSDAGTDQASAARPVPLPAPASVGPAVVWSVGASDCVDASADGCALASDSSSLGESDWGTVQAGAVPVTLAGVGSNRTQPYPAK